MAWRTRTLERTNDMLIDELIESHLLSSPTVEAVMRQVDRGNYCYTDPYTDSPQPIGYSATISAPHMHAMALEMLEAGLARGSRRRALDVGAGSGYLTACMALLQGREGLVVGVEHMPQLAEYAQMNLQNDQPDLVQDGRVQIVVGDGRQGWPVEAPFDVIHVGAASPKEPVELIQQLTPSGTMVVPIGEFGNQWEILVKRTADGRIVYERQAQVSFVPLTDASSQWSGAAAPPPPPLPKIQKLVLGRRPSTLLSAEDLAVINAKHDSDPEESDDESHKKAFGQG